MTSEARAALRDKVARAIWETNSLNVFIAAAIDIALEEAAKLAEAKADEWATAWRNRMKAENERLRAALKKINVGDGWAALIARAALGVI